MLTSKEPGLLRTEDQRASSHYLILHTDELQITVEIKLTCINLKSKYGKAMLTV